MKESLTGAVPDGVCYQNLKHPIHRRSIRMWDFIYYIDSLHYHNYIKTFRHSTGTSYMENIPSTIILVQMKTSITTTSMNYLHDKKIGQTST